MLRVALVVVKQRFEKLYGVVHRNDPSGAPKNMINIVNAKLGDDTDSNSSLIKTQASSRLKRFLPKHKDSDDSIVISNKALASPEPNAVKRKLLHR